MTKNQKGITLIALVITIIVLLILAAVSIAMLTGPNGLLNQATTARDDTKKAEAAERINLALDACYSSILQGKEPSTLDVNDVSNEEQKNGLAFTVTPKPDDAGTQEDNIKSHTYTLTITSKDYSTMSGKISWDSDSSKWKIDPANK